MLQVNIDAGSYPVTTDPLELRAVHIAAQKTWDAFPYYERRYGERGRRFCDSDSAWLVTLATWSRPAAVRQVRWLGGVLSSRGMPQFLLESHLRNLHAALIATIPERRADYAILRYCSTDLTRLRRARIAEQTFRDIASQFNTNAAGGFARFGELLVSAVCDEANGIATAVSSVEPWATDPSMFPPSWISAVQQAITASRAVIAAAPR